MPKLTIEIECADQEALRWFRDRTAALLRLTIEREADLFTDDLLLWSRSTQKPTVSTRPSFSESVMNGDDADGGMIYIFEMNKAAVDESSHEMIDAGVGLLRSVMGVDSVFSPRWGRGVIAPKVKA